MRKLSWTFPLAVVAVVVCGVAFAQRPAPKDHWERRLDKGRVVIREYVDPRFQPLTMVVVADEKMKATVETLFRAVLPRQFGPYEEKNFDGTRNLSVGTEIDTEIMTLNEYGEQSKGKSLSAHRELKIARDDLKDHDVVVIRYFAPKDFFGSKEAR